MQSYELEQAGRPNEYKQPDVTGFYRCIIGLSAAQLLCGIASLALGIANAIICGLLGSIGYGIWGSLILFAGGITGIMAAAKQTRCMVGTHMALSIVAAAAAMVQIGMGVGSAAFDHAALKISRDGGGEPDVLRKLSFGLDYFFMFGCTIEQRNSYWTFQATGPTVTDSLLASFGIIQGIVACLSAIYSCRVCVCPPGVSLYAGEYHHSSQMTIVTKE